MYCCYIFTLVNQLLYCNIEHQEVVASTHFVNIKTKNLQNLLIRTQTSRSFSYLQYCAITTLTHRESYASDSFVIFKSTMSSTRHETYT